MKSSEFIGHALLWWRWRHRHPGGRRVAIFASPSYPIVTALFGAKLVVVPAKNHAHDLDAMLAAITPNTRVVFVANPNNPPAPPRAEELARFVNAVPANVLLALDEAYFEFLNEPLDLLPEIRNGSKPNLLLMRTFSKIYGLAGLRIGYGIGHPDFIAAARKNPPAVQYQHGGAGRRARGAGRHQTRREDAQGQLARTQTLRAHIPQARSGIFPSQANFILVRVGDGQRVFGELQKLA